MVVSFRRTRAIFPFVVAAGAALAAAGCGAEEGVHSYTVPKTADNAKAPAATYRILGAAYPADAPVWFFKFAGTADQVAAHEAEFDQLAASVRLQPDARTLPAFDLPAGWARTGPRTVTRNGVSMKTDETLKFGLPDAPLEVTLTYVPGGGAAQNVDRWAKQVGADGGPDEIQKHTRTFPAAGGTGLRVDLAGPNNPTARPMMGGR